MKAKYLDYHKWYFSNSKTVLNYYLNQQFPSEVPSGFEPLYEVLQTSA